jgi:hypothetical protein
MLSTLMKDNKVVMTKLTSLQQAMMAFYEKTGGWEPAAFLRWYDPKQYWDQTSGKSDLTLEKLGYYDTEALTCPACENTLYAKCPNCPYCSLECPHMPVEYGPDEENPFLSHLPEDPIAIEQAHRVEKARAKYVSRFPWSVTDT